MTIHTKICGLSTPEAVQAAIRGGASYLGVVFYPSSPRHILPQQAAAITLDTPADIQTVAVTVDASDAELEQIFVHFRPGFWQLHGAESPERVMSVRERYGVPVIKALSVAGKDDLARMADYAALSEMLLLDAKAGILPGGNGITFDWKLLQNVDIPVPWLLSGGLTADNVQEAIRVTGARAVDVSSGVESSPGVKSNDKIQGFLEAVRNYGHFPSPL